MARTRRLALLAATILILGGCGGSTTPASAATSRGPSPAATQGPAQSANLASLASQYEAIAARGDVSDAQCDKDKAAAAGSLVKSRAAAQECLADHLPYLDALKAIDWGPAQPQADGVIAAVNRVDALDEQMAGAVTLAGFMVAYDQVAPATTEFVAAANALRAALGLPPVSS